MKTTIVIPELLYKKAKIEAVERGTSLKELMLTALEIEINRSKTEVLPKKPGWATRELLPEYISLIKEGAFSGGSDSTLIISDERDAR